MSQPGSMFIVLPLLTGMQQHARSDLRKQRIQFSIYKNPESPPTNSRQNIRKHLRSFRYQPLVPCGFVPSRNRTWIGLYSSIHTGVDRRLPRSRNRCQRSPGFLLFFFYNSLQFVLCFGTIVLWDYPFCEYHQVVLANVLSTKSQYEDTHPCLYPVASGHSTVSTGREGQEHENSVGTARVLEDAYLVKLLKRF
eukprot:3146595-Rhodomonas_salina.1